MNNHRKGINNRFNLQICYNLKFRTLTGQLTENKYQQMIPTSKTLDIFIAIVFLDKPLEVVSREEIAQLRENISTLVHEYFAFKL